MGRYDTAVRCAQIRNLVEENQYLKAMQEIEDMDYEQIPTISDLYLFADVFLKAEKMDVAKEMYYIAYHRTASRPALYRLLMLTIRMGDIEEARKLYFTYEVIAGITLDTYELRYRLAKAAGEPREKLIDILEHLKKDEYTEEWGFQLARLYEQEGMREQCIKECEDLRRWFGTGPIVRKAEKLRESCMSPLWRKPVNDEIPEPEEPDLEEKLPNRRVRFAYAPAQVEDISVEAVDGAQGIQPEAVREPVIEEKEPVLEPEPASTSEVKKREERQLFVPDQSEKAPVFAPEKPAVIPEVTPEKAENVLEFTQQVKRNLPEPLVAEERESEPVSEQKPISVREAEAAEKKTSLPTEEKGSAPEQSDVQDKEPEHGTGLFKRIVSYFKVDLDMFDEEIVSNEDMDVIEEKLKTETRTVETAPSDKDPTQTIPTEMTSPERKSTKKVGDKEIPTKKIPTEEIRANAAPLKKASAALDMNIEAAATVSYPVESLEEKLQEMEEHREEVLVLDDSLNADRKKRVKAVKELRTEPEDVSVKSHPLGMSAPEADIIEDVSRNGIRYNTLKGVIYKIHKADGMIHFALTGGTSGMSLAVAKKLFKELRKVNYFEAKNIGKISAEKLDAINLEEWAEKFIGGCMYIMEAPSLSNQSVNNLSALIEKYGRQIVLILEGSYDEMDSFLNYHKEFEKLITYKVKL